MPTIDWRSLLWRYALPSLLLSVPGFLPLFVSSETRESDSLEGVMLYGLFVVVPIVAFLIGLILRPDRVWVAPLVAVALFWVSALLNSSARDDWGAGDVLMTLFLLGVPWLAMMWLGRALRDSVEGRRARQQRRQTPLLNAKAPEAPGR